MFTLSNLLPVSIRHMNCMKQGKVQNIFVVDAIWLALFNISLYLFFSLLAVKFTYFTLTELIYLSLKPSFK
jgi:hypothetical protein